MRPIICTSPFRKSFEKEACATTLKINAVYRFGSLLTEAQGLPRQFNFHKYSGLRGGELSDVGTVGCGVACLLGGCRRFGEIPLLRLRVDPLKRASCSSGALPTCCVARSYMDRFLYSLSLFFSVLTYRLCVNTCNVCLISECTGW